MNNFDNLRVNNLEIFDSTDCKIDMSLTYFDRAVAIIKLQNSDKFVVYDRDNDKLWRFCGGHVENETLEITAIRETEEEIGLKNLKVIKYVNSCHKFLLYKNKASHILEHYFLFEITLESWSKRSNCEKGIAAHLKTKTEIQKNNWNQLDWILGQI